ncbi:hypothetical protein ES703_25657 [subsurface metagenome]
MVVKIATELEEEVCITCGIVFAIPENYKAQLRETHKTFYCPNGHSMYFPAETEEENLRRQLRKEKLRREGFQEENIKLTKELNGVLGKINQVKKRAHAGLCPHCRRHFANLERHIHSKHKDKL